MSEAIDWLSRREGNTLPAQQQNEFVRWLNASPDNARAYEEARSLWFAPEIALAARLLPDADVVATEPSVHKRFWRWPTGAMAAAVLLFAVAIGLPEGWNSDYATGTGERKQLHLADGSNMTLNTRTRVSVDINDQERSVVLHTGEAFFQVAKNQQLPFRIFSGDAVVTVIGTEFTVKKEGNHLRVSVQEGIVGVDQKITASGSSNHQRLVAGDSIDFDQSRTTFVAGGAQPQDFSWVNNRLIFENQPLYRAVEEVERYHTGLVFVADENLRNTMVTGNFSLENPVETLHSLAHIQQGKVVNIGDLLIVIKKE